MGLRRAPARPRGLQPRHQKPARTRSEPSSNSGVRSDGHQNPDAERPGVALETPLRMRPATVAIVGRPNVGKSALFNRLVGRRLAIVDDTPGVTRDRLYAVAEWRGRVFSLVDTAGIDVAPHDDADIARRTAAQAEIAARE